jgi:hypothetical protein
MRTTRSLALVPVLLLGLGACAGGPLDAEQEACWSVHAWTSGGAPADLFDETITEMQDYLVGSDDADLVAAADALAGAAEPDRPAAAEAFVEQCEALGWEPREG